MIFYIILTLLTKPPNKTTIMNINQKVLDKLATLDTKAAIIISVDDNHIDFLSTLDKDASIGVMKTMLLLVMYFKTMNIPREPTKDTGEPLQDLINKKFGQN